MFRNRFSESLNGPEAAKHRQTLFKCDFSAFGKISGSYYYFPHTWTQSLNREQGITGVRKTQRNLSIFRKGRQWKCRHKLINKWISEKVTLAVEIEGTRTLNTAIASRAVWYCWGRFEALSTQSRVPQWMSGYGIVSALCFTGRVSWLIVLMRPRRHPARANVHRFMFPWNKNTLLYENEEPIICENAPGNTSVNLLRKDRSNVGQNLLYDQMDFEEKNKTAAVDQRSSYP